MVRRFLVLLGYGFRGSAIKHFLPASLKVEGLKEACGYFLAFHVLVGSLWSSSPR